MRLEVPSSKAILFDLNGTIAEFKFPFHESRFALFDLLWQSSYNLDSFRESMQTQIADLADAQGKESEFLRELEQFYNAKA